MAVISSLHAPTVLFLTKKVSTIFTGSSLVLVLMSKRQLILALAVFDNIRPSPCVVMVNKMTHDRL